jgi:hypothetical protein
VIVLVTISAPALLGKTHDPAFKWKFYGFLLYLIGGLYQPILPFFAVVDMVGMYHTRNESILSRHLAHTQNLI